jgi:hypothetical protein
MARVPEETEAAQKRYCLTAYARVKRAQEVQVCRLSTAVNACGSYMQKAHRTKEGNW